MVPWSWCQMRHCWSMGVVPHNPRFVEWRWQCNVQEIFSSRTLGPLGTSWALFKCHSLSVDMSISKWLDVTKQSTTLQQLCYTNMSIWTKISDQCVQHLFGSVTQRIKAVQKGKKVFIRLSYWSISLHHLLSVQMDTDNASTNKARL